MSLIKPKAPRWYRDENGVVEACYQVPSKNKAFLKKFGHAGMKDTTLREARELGLLPSVTSILRVMAQPGLERWKMEQVIHSALTLPRLRMDWDDWWAAAQFKCPMVPRDMMEWAYDHPPEHAEAEDAFARRVAEDSEAQAAKAAEFGTRIHDAIAEIINEGIMINETVRASELWPYLEHFVYWARDNIEEIHAVEKVVGGKRCGYAGRLDLDCTLRGVGRTLVDFKTQGIKEGKPPVFYEDSWLPQLAAYRDACTDCIPRIMSLVIDSRAPGPVWPKLWDMDEMRRGTKIFVYCRELWKALNDYDPAQPKEEDLPTLEDVQKFYKATTKPDDPTAGVKQAREDYALKQMGILPMKELE